MVHRGSDGSDVELQSSRNSPPLPSAAANSTKCCTSHRDRPSPTRGSEKPSRVHCPSCAWVPMRTRTSASDPRPCAPRFTRLKSRRNCAARLIDRTPRPPCRADHLWSRASSAIASPGVASSTTSRRLAASSRTYRNRRHGRRWPDLTGPPAPTVSDQAGARATGRAVGHGFDRPPQRSRGHQENAPSSIERRKEARKALRWSGRSQKTPGGVIQAFYFCGTICGTTFISYCFY